MGEGAATIGVVVAREEEDEEAEPTEEGGNNVLDVYKTSHMKPQIILVVLGLK